MNTLLLVEDSPMLLDFTARNLAHELPGTRILRASSRGQALALAKDDRPRVLVVDWHLGEGDGVELARELVAGTPELKVVVVSGEEHPPLRPDEPFRVIAKPCEPEQLVEAVRSALGELADAEEARGEGQERQERAETRRAREFDWLADRHRMKNQLTGLHAGIKAFAADLRAAGADAPIVLALIDEYERRLLGIVRELSAAVKTSPRRTEAGQ